MLDPLRWRASDVLKVGRRKGMISGLLEGYGDKVEWLFGETGASVTVRMPRATEAAT